MVAAFLGLFDYDDDFEPAIPILFDSIVLEKDGSGVVLVHRTR